jgi:hypothetical protein
MLQYNNIPYFTVSYIFESGIRLIYATAVSTGLTQDGQPCFFVTDVEGKTVELLYEDVADLSKF